MLVALLYAFEVGTYDVLRFCSCEFCGLQMWVDFVEIVGTGNGISK